MSTNNTLSQKHNLLNEGLFHLKSALFVTLRQFQNLFASLKKFRRTQQLQGCPVIAVSDSELWNADDTPDNWILTAGKIQNLRLAARYLNGIEVPANQIFSFWKHIGNPNFGKGYVIGREIREGCIVPTIAGGLCQLSNALYDAALKANFEIIERHRHTRVIKGSLAEQDRDATIKWNYVDLRLRSATGFRIEVDLIPDKLVVRFRGNLQQMPSAGAGKGHQLKPVKLNDCYSCGNFGCFKHPYDVPVKREQAVTAFILDDKWPEYDEYLKSIATDNDYFILPFLKNRLGGANRYSWTIKNAANVKSTAFAAIKRAVSMRLFSGPKNNVFSLMLRLDRNIARAAAGKIPLEATHLVVSQNLLPFLWEEGVFGGRTFDVLMTRLPMEKLHERLDMAHANFPESETLNDFRAAQTLIDLENAALTKSRKVITPHAEIAAIFNNKSVKLNWAAPQMAVSKITGNKILFPASALGRKGAYEVRRLASELNLSIVITGKATETENFWNNINVETANGNVFNDVALVVYPAYVEHQPRMLLKAIAAGIPVVTTTACGLVPAERVSVVPVGDYIALRQAVQQYLKKQDNSILSVALPMENK